MPNYLFSFGQSSSFLHLFSQSLDVFICSIQQDAILRRQRLPTLHHNENNTELLMIEWLNRLRSAYLYIVYWLIKIVLTVHIWLNNLNHIKLLIIQQKALIISTKCQICHKWNNIYSKESSFEFKTIYNSFKCQHFSLERTLISNIIRYCLTLFLTGLFESKFLLGGGGGQLTPPSDLGPKGANRREILHECQDTCKEYCYKKKIAENGLFVILL